MDQYSTMYQQHDYVPNRSPSSTRGYNGTSTLNRQPSRHFQPMYDNGLSQPLYTSDNIPPQRYDTEPRYDGRIPGTSMPTHYAYDSQTWGYAAGGSPASTMVIGTGRMAGAGQGRARRTPLPSPWLSESQTISSMPSSIQSFHQPNGQYTMHPPSTAEADESAEANIPTAIVIKNIPFSVKKEQLVEIMSEMSLPLPYAFNYHFDGGVFRGLAFANFTTPDETFRVINALNHYDLQGRKLRVEYKRMLPAADRDRIEREKRERRGQLQEQHQPMNTQHLQNQESMGSLRSNIPSSASPIPYHAGEQSLEEGIASGKIDLKDTRTAHFFSDLITFRTDMTRDNMPFTGLNPQDRLKVHTIAHYLGLDHVSDGVEPNRKVTVMKRRNPLVPSAQPPPAPSSLNFYAEPQPRTRGLNRAATTDFSETRAQAQEANYANHSLSRQGSDLLGIPDSSATLNNLRGAKSFADLRSFSPSPSTSSTSFPTGLTQNVSRFSEFHNQATAQTHGSASGTPTNLSPEDFPLTNVINGMGQMSFQSERAFRAPGSGATPMRAQERENHAGPIGSQRLVNGGYDEGLRNGTTIERAERQPRGPGSEWGQGQGGFSRPRQNGHVTRNSGEHELNGLGLGWDDNRA